LPNLPSKAIVGKSFHGCGFQSPPVRWWVESYTSVEKRGNIWVSKALPLGGGLKVIIIEDATLAI
jgi:hypothetical protein